MSSTVNVTSLRGENDIERLFVFITSKNKSHNEARIIAYAYPHQAGGRIIMFKEYFD